MRASIHVYDQILARLGPNETWHCFNYAILKFGETHCIVNHSTVNVTTNINTCM